MVDFTNFYPTKLFRIRIMERKGSAIRNSIKKEYDSQWALLTELPYLSFGIAVTRDEQSHEFDN